MSYLLPAWAAPNSTNTTNVSNATTTTHRSLTASESRSCSRVSPSSPSYRSSEGERDTSTSVPFLSLWLPPRHGVTVASSAASAKADKHSSSPSSFSAAAAAGGAGEDPSTGSGSTVGRQGGTNERMSACGGHHSALQGPPPPPPHPRQSGNQFSSLPLSSAASAAATAALSHLPTRVVRKDPPRSELSISTSVSTSSVVLSAPQVCAPPTHTHTHTHTHTTTATTATSASAATADAVVAATSDRDTVPLHFSSRNTVNAVSPAAAATTRTSAFVEGSVTKATRAVRPSNRHKHTPTQRNTPCAEDGATETSTRTKLTQHQPWRRRPKSPPLTSAHRRTTSLTSYSVSSSASPSSSRHSLSDQFEPSRSFPSAYLFASQPPAAADSSGVDTHRRRDASSSSSDAAAAVGGVVIAPAADDGDVMQSNAGPTRPSAPSHVHVPPRRSSYSLSSASCLLPPPPPATLHPHAPMTELKTTPRVTPRPLERLAAAAAAASAATSPSSPSTTPPFTHRAPPRTSADGLMMMMGEVRMEKLSDFRRRARPVSATVTVSSAKKGNVDPLTESAPQPPPPTTALHATARDTTRTTTTTTTTATANAMYTTSAEAAAAAAASYFDRHDSMADVFSSSDGSSLDHPLLTARTHTSATPFLCGAHSASTTPRHTEADAAAATVSTPTKSVIVVTARNLFQQSVFSRLATGGSSCNDPSSARSANAPPPQLLQPLRSPRDVQQQQQQGQQQQHEERLLPSHEQYFPPPSMPPSADVSSGSKSCASPHVMSSVYSPLAAMTEAGVALRSYSTSSASSSFSSYASSRSATMASSSCDYAESGDAVHVSRTAHAHPHASADGRREGSRGTREWDSWNGSNHCQNASPNRSTGHYHHVQQQQQDSDGHNTFTRSHFSDHPHLHRHHRQQRHNNNNNNSGSHINSEDFPRSKHASTHSGGKTDKHDQRCRSARSAGQQHPPHLNVQTPARTSAAQPPKPKAPSKSEASSRLYTPPLTTPCTPNQYRPRNRQEELELAELQLQLAAYVFPPPPPPPPPLASPPRQASVKVSSAPSTKASPTRLPRRPQSSNASRTGNTTAFLLEARSGQNSSLSPKRRRENAFARTTGLTTTCSGTALPQPARDTHERRAEVAKREGQGGTHDGPRVTRKNAPTLLSP